MLTLNTIAIGQQVRVVRFHQRAVGFRHKLLAMGLTPGVTVTVVQVAPLGDPIQVYLRGFTLSLRKKECQLIEVEPIHGSRYSPCKASNAIDIDHCACR
jgi:ferrous iron transport protein A